MYYLLRCVGLAVLLVGAFFPTLGLKAAVQSVQSHSLSRQANSLAQSNDEEFEYEDFDFWAEQCLLLRDEQNDAEALIACEKAISLEPEEDNVELWIARGDILFRSGQYAESLVSYNRVVAASPNYSSAIASQCAALYQLQRYDEAVDRCEEALRIDGNWGTGSPALAWFYRGLSLGQLGRLETALASFERALLIEPEDPQAIAARCSVLAELGNTETFAADCTTQDAVTSYEQAIADDAGNVALWVQQGLALEQQGITEVGAYERALTSYDRAVELNPENSIVLARRCDVLNQLENYEAALESCEQAFQGDKRWGSQELVHAWNQHSIALAGLGRYEEALASADRAIAIDASYAPAWNSRAISLWRLNPLDPAALTAIDRSIQLYAESEALLEDTFERTYPGPAILFYRGQILAWFNKGRLLSSITDYEAATQAYIQALDINETVNLRDIQPLTDATVANIWANLAATYLHIDPVQSLTVSQRAVNLDRRSFAGWYNQALALTQLGRYNEALYAYEQAEQVNPNNVEVMTGRGIALAENGQTQAAIETFNQVLNLDPNQTVAQHYLDRLLNVEQP